MNSLTNQAFSLSLALSLTLVSTLGCSTSQTSAPSGKADAVAAPAAKPPLAKAGDASDVYFGVTVKDPYRALEPIDGAETKAFIEAQNAFARRTLDALPGRAAIQSEVRAILDSKSDSYSALSEVGGTFYALKLQPPKQQRFLVKLSGLKSGNGEQVILDPQTIDPKNRTTIDFYRVSPNGKWVAVSLSENGSEEGSVSIFEVATGKKVFEQVPRVYIAGGDLEWAPNNSGFIYTRSPRGQERPKEDMNFFTQIYFHKLGTPTATDRYEIGKDFLKIGQPVITDAKGGALLLALQKGDGGEFQHYLRTKDGVWRQLADFDDKIAKFAFGENNDLYAVSLKGAPLGKIVHGPLQGFDVDKAAVVIKEGKDAIISDIYSANTLLIANGRIYLAYQTGGPSEIRGFDLSGKSEVAPEAPAVSSVSNIIKVSNGSVVFAARSFLEPTAYYHFDPKTGKTLKTPLAEQNPIDVTGFTVTREFARSKDGTMIPVNIVLPKGVKPGTPIPFIVTGYGGFNINFEPRFLGAYGALLKAGVGYASVNLRGGSEFGTTWHEQGSLLKKQNVYDDFIAAIEHLGTKNFADPTRIAIVGGSNGGLLMGAVLTQRPELFRAVVAMVGYYDMVRYENEPNGQLNATEYGSVKNKGQFEALYAYSPYHRIKDGVKYPAALFTVGATDVRVAPWHSRKMVARLQVATSGEWPLLVTTFDAGHGAGSSVEQRIEQFTDSFSFVLNQFGMSKN